MTRPYPCCVLFDLGDTLLDVRGVDTAAGTAAVLAHAAPGTSVTVAEVEHASRRLFHDLDARAGSSSLEISARTYHRLLYGSLGVRIEADPALMEEAFWRAALRMAPAAGAADALARLAAAGFTLGVVSNSIFSGRILRAELAIHGLLDRLAFVMSSADYGVRKPHPALFSAAVAASGAAPDHTWFVGDSLANDVGGAVQSGLRPVWYGPEANPTGAPVALIAPTMPDVVAAILGDLAG